MSFCTKSIVCDFCHTCVPICDINFPEDLYDLIVKYNVEQLYWICATCKKKKEQTFSHVLSLAEKQMKMEQRLNDLSDTVNKMKQEASDCASLSNGYLSGEIPSIKDTDSSYWRADKMGSIYGKELDCSTDSLNSTVSSPLSSEIYTQASYTFSNCKNDSEFRDQFLKEKIKINPEQETRSKKIMTDFLEMLTTELKTDTLFKSLFQKLYYTGSYYDDLRIVDATEFDINLVLKFPFKTDMRVIEYPKTIKSFVKYRLTDTDFSAKANLSEEKKKLCLQVQKTFFENHYLMPNKVKQWMQSIFDKLFKKGMSIENVKDVLNSASGPAKTVKLITKFGYDIDVDLVPVIEIVSPEWPKGVDKTPLHKFNVLQHEQFWFLVPKSYDGKQNLQCSEAECFWRMHFPEVEKKILYKRGMVKPIIKTLKLLRNKQDWKILSSYYLKTVVMWAVVEEPSADYWREENFWDRLLLMLKKLQKFLQERKIPYLFHQSFNLIEKINEDHANNLCFRLKKIISCLEKDYRNIYNFT